MNCVKCAYKLKGEEVYCPNCGTKVDRDIKADNTLENTKSASLCMGIVALSAVALVIFAPAALVLSIVGLILAIKANKHLKNTAGIVINSVALFLSLTITIIMIFAISLLVAIFREEIWTDYNHGDPVVNYSEKF